MNRKLTRPGSPSGVLAGCNLALSCALIIACGDAASARPQLLVFVDTNALLAAQTFEPDNTAAAFDSLRIDLLAPDGSIVDYLDVVVPTIDAWPVSFGVAAEGAQQESQLLRVRLFSGRHATRGQNAGRSTLEPEPSATIDRVIGVDFPLSGIRKVGVFLDAECLGSAATFAPNINSCVSRTKTNVQPELAFKDLDTDWLHSKAGTWSALKQTACEGTGPNDSICVPGGFTLLGDRALAVPVEDLFTSAYPFRPSLISPFWMDRTEFTVGHLRQLLANPSSAEVLDELGLARLEMFDDCTWRGSADGTQDAFALNCISPVDAEAVCRTLGGSLPSEAQWEYAARGHGADWLFPWGDQPATCCRARLSRLEGSDIVHSEECPGFGPTPEDALLANDCEGDVSIDGIVDLGGNLTEATLDTWMPWSEDSTCWPARGILRDPSCDEGAAVRVGRGGNWSTGFVAARSSHRAKYYAGIGLTVLGFRCVYEDKP